MFIHSISPVSNIPRQSLLTYFSKDELSAGTLVEVLYGKNKILGIVLTSSPLKSMKEVVRTQDFQLRKINRVIEKEKIDSHMVEALQKWSNEQYLPAGKILTDIFPKWFWGEKFEIQQPHPNPFLTETVHLLDSSYRSTHELSQKVLRSGPLSRAHLARRGGKIQNIEASFTERTTQYKKEILAHDTAWICVPSVLALKKIQTLIKNNEVFKGYELLSFHSTIAEQKQIKQYKSFDQHKKTIILSTPYYFGLFHDTANLIIYENTGDDGYTLGQKYTYDALTLFKNIGSNVKEHIYGGDLLPVSGNWIPDLVRNDNTSKTNKNSTRKINFIGYTKENTRYNELFVSEHIEKQFLNDVSKDKNILIVTQYKDNNIKIVCNDCKTTVTCPTCKLALHTLVKNGASYFHCRFCKKSYKSNVKCTNCQSWNLTALGINTKTIKEFVERKYKHVSKELLTITSLSDVEKYGNKEFDSVYVISIDGIMHSSHFATEEKIIRTLLKIQELGNNLHVQTSFPFPNILSVIKNISIEKWKKEELKKRKQYHYPPFGTLYSITVGTLRDQKLLHKIQTQCDIEDILHIDSMYRMTIYTDTKNNSKVEALLNEYRESGLVIKVDK